MVKSIKKLAISAMFLGIGIILPFFTGQLEGIGNMLLPMHLPVFLCGLICGWKYGAGVGFTMPLIRSLIFTKPPLYPNAVVYAFELCTYGFVIGIVWMLSKEKNIKSIYASMLFSMLCGRIVWAAAKIVTMGIDGGRFTFAMFLSGAFLEAVPGIILQLVIIPAIMVALNRAKFFPFN